MPLEDMIRMNIMNDKEIYPDPSSLGLLCFHVYVHKYVFNVMKKIGLWVQEMCVWGGVEVMHLYVYKSQIGGWSD